MRVLGFVSRVGDATARTSPCCRADAAPACVQVQFSPVHAVYAAMQREELNRYLDGLLEVSRFRDYCPNGLQVEGRGVPRRRSSRHRAIRHTGIGRAFGGPLWPATQLHRHPQSGATPGHGRNGLSAVLFLYFRLLAHKALIGQRLSGIIPTFCTQQKPGMDRTGGRSPVEDFPGQRKRRLPYRPDTRFPRRSRKNQ